MDKVIAIDGPSGSGKSTITKKIAKKLGFTYIDTGAMYRAVAYKLDSLEIPFNDADVRAALKDFNFEYAPTPECLIQINGVDLTDKIREHKVSKIASQTSKLPSVREFLFHMQKSIATQRKSILEGRDIGTVIFPNAALKIYLSASSQMRAKRRLAELEERGDISHDFEQILADIEKRDFEDMNRQIAPLKKADDAIEIDTTDMNIDQVVDEVEKLYIERSSLFNT